MAIDLRDGVRLVRLAQLLLPRALSLQNPRSNIETEEEKRMKCGWKNLMKRVRFPAGELLYS